MDKKMFEIFIYVIFVIIIYFIIQKYNCQEKFDDMPPLPGGTWTNSCSRTNSNLSWTKNDLGQCTLSTVCKLPKIGRQTKWGKTSINLENCNSTLKNNNGILEIE